VLEPLPKQEDISLAKSEIHISNDCLDIAFNQQSEVISSEEDRRKGIESKAALFLSSISITNSIVVASANSLISHGTEITLVIRASILISLILSIYSIRTVWFSIKALERKSFKVIGFKDINIEASKEEYQKKLILKMHEYAFYNQKTINEKVDYLVMAQEYYKRAIVIIFLYALMIFTYAIFY
jgi:hypothetical protein